MPLVHHTLVVALLALLAGPAFAQTTVTDAWVRATVPQQKATGVFMQLKSAAGGRLVGASSPVAGVVEVHEMVLDGNVMRMRPVAALELPAGKAVELRPGGYHVMLMDLKSTLQAGDTVPLTLTIEGRDGKRESVALNAPVRPPNAMVPASQPMHKH